MQPDKKRFLFILGIMVCHLFFLYCGDPTGPNEVPEDFGVYSETTTESVKLDTDGFLGIDFGGGGGFIPSADSGFVDDTNDTREGNESKRSTINVAASGQWAIWFVQHGLTSSNNETKNMSDYRGGSIDFWVKAEPEIRDLLVGIRSGNVSAGDEKKVLAGSYGFEANSQWHKLSIPLDDLEGDPPNADLSKIKVFFVVGSGSDDTGGTNGDATFWIDDVRWVAKPQN